MTGGSAADRALADALRHRGLVRSERVLDALASVPRAAFLPRDVRDEAGRDAPVPIGSGQTMSAPHIVGMMADALDVRPGDRVLEVGGGSGYHAAVLATLAGPRGHVWTVERVPALAAAAERRLARAGFTDRVSVHEGDGARGLPAVAPFHRVSVACGAPHVPPALVEQLAPGGALVIPLGSRDAQDLARVTKHADGSTRTEWFGPVRFVPLVGPEGFPA